MTVGERIKKYRQERGMTQKELGDKCGLADSAIRRYELGGANPKIKQLQKIANALNIPAEYLFEPINISLMTDNDCEKIDFLLSKGEKDFQSILLQNGYSLVRQGNNYIIQKVANEVYGKKIKISQSEYNELTAEINFFIKHLVDKEFNNHDYYFGDSNNT